MTYQWWKHMVISRTSSGIRTVVGREMRSENTIHVEHDTKSSRASKMRRVLLRNMLSTGFNHWRRLFTGVIVTEERVWPGAMATASGRIYSDRERLLQHQSSYPLTHGSVHDKGASRYRLKIRHIMCTCDQCNCWAKKMVTAVTCVPKQSTACSLRN